MNFAKSISAALILVAAALAPAAQATTINFNNLAGTNVAGNNYFDGTLTQVPGGSTFTNSGFKFTGSSWELLIGTTYSGSDANSYAYNGTDYLISYLNVTIASATASPFTVNSLNLAPWYEGQGVTQATLTGTKVGGGIVSQIIDLNTINNSAKVSGNDFSNYVLSGFSNLSSLTISHNGSYYLAIDNLVINATTVPEPSSLALFGLAIAGCAFARRRAGESA